MNKKLLTGLLSVASVTLLAACSTDQTDTQDTVSSIESSVVSESSSEGMGGMEHNDSGELPAGLRKAENPEYEVGEQVTLLNDHMPGMEGATATIVGAFDTVAYEVTYQPTNGGELEENHKWVIQEEITEAKDQTEVLEPGTEVTLEAKHMEGMEGATATIDSAEDTTVYMIDYEPTDGGETVRNHKWFVGEEFSPVENQ